MCPPRVVAAGNCAAANRAKKMQAQSISKPTAKEQPKEVIYNGVRYYRDEPKIDTGEDNKDT
jgi:predicted peroxiredoxin